MAEVFVTGATGVLGRGATARLLEAGYAVRALARTAERSPAVAATSANPVVGDIYDLASMTRAVSGCDAVLHLATRIPPIAKARRVSAWAENSKLREVGTKVLVDAVLGPPDGFVSPIHTHDAASAVVAALAAPAGIYNVVDDEPLTRRQFADAFASAFGLHRPLLVPRVVVRLTGGAMTSALMRSQRVRNTALTRATGWKPVHSSAVDGWAEIAAERQVAANV
jgi:nucleoside-diphosphate-sugar epimerase